MRVNKRCCYRRLRWQERVFEHEATAYQDSAARHDATDSNLDQAFWRWSGGANTLLLGREVFTWGLRPSLAQQPGLF
jgi:hypothetical protein